MFKRTRLVAGEADPNPNPNPNPSPDPDPDPNPNLEVGEAEHALGARVLPVEVLVALHEGAQQPPRAARRGCGGHGVAPAMKLRLGRLGLLLDSRLVRVR